MKKGDVENKEGGRIGLTSIILFFAMLGLAFAFYLTLSGVSPSLSPGDEREFSFGLSDTIFSLSFAFLITAFLVWCKSVMTKNPYLGAGIGVIGLIAVAYGISLQYFGTYTITFMAIGGIFGISYLGFHFVKNKGKDKFIPNEFDEE